MAPKTFKVTQTHSVAGTPQAHRACVKGLGLRRIRHTVTVLDNPCTRGMARTVSYLVKVEG